MPGESARLHALLEPVVAAMGYELLGIELAGSGRRSLLRIYIDSASGVSLADCERVSLQVGAVLDVEDAMRGPYTLEVSSPGVDRPLFTLAHFQRFTGARARIRLRVPLQNRRSITGRIAAVRGDRVAIESQGVEYLVPIGQIARARVVADWR